VLYQEKVLQTTLFRLRLCPETPRGAGERSQAESPTARASPLDGTDERQPRTKASEILRDADDEG